jgi:hypothetical protein
VDLTAEENDARYGYISRVNTKLVPINQTVSKAATPNLLSVLNGGSTHLGNKLIDMMAENLMTQLGGGMRTQVA